MLERFKEWWSTQTFNHKILGLDIGLDAIKLVQLKLNNSNYAVEHIATIPLPADSITKDGIKNPETIGSILKDYLNELNINTKNVAIAIPRSSAIIKDITVDKRLTEAEIESRVWIEANRHFPELVGEIYLDFVLTGPAANDSAQSNIMLVACRKDQVKQYFDVLNLAGLTLKVIDVNSYALDRALKRMLQNTSQSDVVGLLNLNLSLSSFIVGSQTELIYTLDQSYDGARLINQVNDYLAKNTTANDDNAYFQVLKDNLISHLRHTMHFFYSSRPHVTIQKFYLSGDCSNVPHLAQFIQQEISIETTLANPFLNIEPIDSVEKNAIEKSSAIFMLSTGLALSHTHIKDKMAVV